MQYPVFSPIEKKENYTLNAISSNFVQQNKKKYGF